MEMQKPGAPAPKTPPASAPAQGMGPSQPPQTAAQVNQTASEGLNVAVQAGLEAVEAVEQDQTVPDETKAKIAQGVTILAEANDELSAPAVMPAPGGPVA